MHGEDEALQLAESDLRYEGWGSDERREKAIFWGGVLLGNVQTRILCNQDSAVVSLVAS